MMAESARRSEPSPEGWRAADHQGLLRAQGASEKNGKVFAHQAGSDVRRGEDNSPDQTPNTSDVEVGLDDLLLAARYRYEQQQSYSADATTALLGQYSQNEQVHIEDKYIRPVGVCLLVGSTRRFHRRDGLEIKTYYDGRFVGALQPKFEETLWRARVMERRMSEVSDRRSRQALTKMVYSTCVFLFSVMDSLWQSRDSDKPGGGLHTRDIALDHKGEQRVREALVTACAELAEVERIAAKSELRNAIKKYLTGMGLGALILLILGVLFGRGILPSVLDADQQDFTLVLVAGGIGAAASVMARLTRGQAVEVDSRQRAGIIMLAGGLRPMVGAVLALAIYCLIRAALLPIAAPHLADAEVYFFTSIGFLAGFSERWAQDTILRSDPIRSKSIHTSGSDSLTLSREAPAKTAGTQVHASPDELNGSGIQTST